MGRRAGVTADETKEQLTRAAARVFAERGYEGATIADIARQAGLSTGAIYAHYRSKAQLLAEAIREQSAREVARTMGHDGATSLTDAMVALGAGLARRGRRKGSLLLEAVSAARHDPELAQNIAAQVGGSEQRFADAVRRAQAAGTAGFRAPPEVIARFSTMLNLGSLVVDGLSLEPVDEDEWRMFMTDLVHGFRPGARTGTRSPTADRTTGGADE